MLKNSTEADVLMPLEIFCCYAHEDQKLLRQLQSHLMPLQRKEIVTFWADLEINAGAEWEEEIKVHLDSANIILLLISPDFMASDYCYSKEMMRALERQKNRQARVVPIILRPVYWQGILGQLQALPENGKPVTLWPNQDEAFLNIAEGIYKLSQILIKNDTEIPKKSTRYLTISKANRKQHKKAMSKIAIVAIVTTIIILSVPTVWIYTRNFQITTPAKNAWQDYKNATQTAPTINDLLKVNNQGHRWTEETTESDEIFFQNNTYHIHAFQQGSYAFGCESQLSVDNVAFQVSMTMLPGETPGHAGVVLGCESNLQYIFSLDPAQNYEVDQIDTASFSGSSSTRLAEGHNPLIHSGYATSNSLEVLDRRGSIELFVNDTYLTTLSITDTSGYVGFAVRDDNGPFEAIFQNFKFWI
jgi:TIR domain